MPTSKQPSGARSLRERLTATVLENPRINSRSLGWMAAAMTIGILLIGWWPLRFSAPNNAGWLAGTNGLQFPGGEARSAFDPGGIVYSPRPLVASPTAVVSAFSVELLLRPAKEPAGARARIFSLADAVGSERFFIGQWSTQLLVMIRQSAAGGDAAFREHDVKQVFKAGQPRLITLTADGGGCAIYLDGRLARRIAGVSLLGTNGTLAGHRVFLGNSPDGRNPWAGELGGLALHDRALSAAEVRQYDEGWLPGGSETPLRQSRPMARYEFREAAGLWITNSIHAENPLLMPATFSQQKATLSLDGFTRLDPGDLALNIFGFVPYGLVLSLWVLRLRSSPVWLAIVIATLAGAMVSLGIEWMQVWLPTRDSSLADVATNTLGALLGGWVPCSCRGKARQSGRANSGSAGRIILPGD